MLGAPTGFVLGRRGAGQLSPWLAGTTLMCGGVGPVTEICSAKDYQRPAVWALRWNNPKVHTPERRKVWLACDEHRDYLRDYLAARDFPVRVVEGLPEAPP